MILCNLCIESGDTLHLLISLESYRFLSFLPCSEPVGDVQMHLFLAGKQAEHSGSLTLRPLIPISFYQLLVGLQQRSLFWYYSSDGSADKSLDKKMLPHRLKEYL